MHRTSVPVDSQKVSDAEAREAFAGLVRRYHRAAIAYAYALLRNYAAAEDATQAAFLTLASPGRSPRTTGVQQLAADDRPHRVFAHHPPDAPGDGSDRRSIRATLRTVDIDS